MFVIALLGLPLAAHDQPAQSPCYNPYTGPQPRL